MNTLAHRVYALGMTLLLAPVIYAIAYGIVTHGLYFYVLGVKP